MSDNNKPWVVDVQTMNQWGICGPIDESEGKSFAWVTYPSGSAGNVSGSQFLLRFSFNWERTNNAAHGYINATGSVLTWVRQTYDVSGPIGIDSNIFPELVTYDPPIREANAVTNHNVERFETEAEAIEFAESQKLVPLITFNDGDYLFRASFREEVAEGVWVDRNVGLQHAGDPVKIYTILDLENYYNNAMNLDNGYPVFGGFNISLTQEFCETSLNITIHNVDTNVASVITVDPDFQNIPGSSTVTIVDGDPVVSGTMLENGNGSVTVSDNGNILMLNDGGTFFLNEFGNVGFYANGDASLTADNQVQLGVGQNSVTVENGSLTIRDETGSATLTAEDINRLKELLGE